MNNIKLIDVTLRDGGYKTNFNFADKTIRSLLQTLDNAGIAYVEVGYRNGSFKPIANIGPTGLCAADYLLYCRQYLSRAKLTVIAHPKNINYHDLQEMRDNGVDAVRICFSTTDPLRSFDLIDFASQLGFEVFVNITRVSHYAYEQIRTWVTEIKDYTPQAIYFADSNGSLTPHNIKKLFTALRSEFAIKFGFHAHDNLFLAQANSVTAIHSGTEFIDSALYGFGKGVGNLRTEGIVSYLCSTGVCHYDLCQLLEAAEYVRKHLHHNETQALAKDIIHGVFDLSQDDVNQLHDCLDIKEYYRKAAQFKQQSLRVNTDEKNISYGTYSR